jgi:hypothetical protein
VSEYRDYENGVADVLAFLAGAAATVERNVRLHGRRTGKHRQIDVLVRGRIFAMADAMLIVDCKRWAKPIDVQDVESFLGMAEDVGADVAFLMTTKGATSGAQARASQERGVRLEVMSLEELRAWSPSGTVTATYRLPADRKAASEKALRNAGFRVSPDSGYPATDAEVVLVAFRHYGTRHPSGEVQRDHTERCEATLRKIDIKPMLVAHGVTIAGGTPRHRWLEVAVNGVATGLRVLAGTEEDADKQLDRLADSLASSGIGRTSLSLIRPDNWPVEGIFGS